MSPYNTVVGPYNIVPQTESNEGVIEVYGPLQNSYNVAFPILLALFL